VAASAILDVRDAVTEILKGAEALSGIEVSDDREPERSTEYIWIWKAESNRDFAGIGSQPPKLDEDIEITLRVVAMRGTDELRPSEDRAFEIANAAEKALAQQTTLNKTVRFHWVSKVKPTPFLFDRKRGCEVVMTLSAKARI